MDYGVLEPEGTLEMSLERWKSEQRCGAEPPQAEGKPLGAFVAPLPVSGPGPPPGGLLRGHSTPAPLLMTLCES